MAILSKNTTIGGKIPLTTDVNIAAENIAGMAAFTVSGNIDANNLLLEKLALNQSHESNIKTILFEKYFLNIAAGKAELRSQACMKETFL